MSNEWITEDEMKSLLEWVKAQDQATKQAIALDVFETLVRFDGHQNINPS